MQGLITWTLLLPPPHHQCGETRAVELRLPNTVGRLTHLLTSSASGVIRAGSNPDRAAGPWVLAEVAMVSEAADIVPVTQPSAAARSCCLLNASPFGAAP